MSLNGLNDFTNRLKQIGGNAKKINGQHDIPLSQLFNESFMKKHTAGVYSSFNDFIEKSGYGDIPFPKIPDDKWETWVHKSTDFDSWADMQNTAMQNYIVHNIFG